MSQALWDRWEGFLSKIVERQREILAEAEEGIGALIAAHPEDPVPLGNALSGLRFRMEELYKKLDDTWEGQVSAKFAEVSNAFEERGRDRGEDVKQTLTAEYEALAVRLSADFYRNLAPRAAAAREKPAPCMMCGAPLPLPTRSEAVSITCPYCSAVNQVMPDRAASLYLGAGHALAEEAALPLRHAVQRFRVEAHRRRRASNWSPEPVDSLDHWVQLERAYWEKYAAVKAQVLGVAPDRDLIESRMRQFMEYTVMQDQSWRRAKGI